MRRILIANTCTDSSYLYLCILRVSSVANYDSNVNVAISCCGKVASLVALYELFFLFFLLMFLLLLLLLLLLLYFLYQGFQIYQ